MITLWFISLLRESFWVAMVDPFVLVARWKPELLTSPIFISETGLRMELQKMGIERIGEAEIGDNCFHKLLE